MVLSIVFGLLGIFLLVLVHELGHFLFARLVGIKVEVFSVGFGPKIWKKQIGQTQYAFSLVPLGGYCKMAGEILIENQQPQPGDMYYGKAWRRTLAVLGGPLFSLAGGLLFFVCAVFFPHLEDLTPNRIVVSQDSLEGLGSDTISKLEPLNFVDGDRIIAIDASDIQYYQQIQRIVFTSPRRRLQFTVERGSEIVSINATPILLENGQGFLPLFPWYEPVIVNVKENSPATEAGLQKGDRILEINGNVISHRGEIIRLVRESDVKMGLMLKVDRLQEIKDVIVYPRYEEDLQKPFIGVEFGGYKKIFVDGEHNPFFALLQGGKNFANSLGLYLRGLGNLFRGVKLFRAISGPVRNMYFIGEVAKTTVSEDDDGIRRISLHNILMMLAFISIALGVMNLLPIPLLDGGILVLYGIESLRGKYLTPKALSIYQYIGLAFIGFLLLLSVGSDIFFILKK